MLATYCIKIKHFNETRTLEYLEYSSMFQSALLR